MTEQQKTAIEEAAENHADKHQECSNYPIQGTEKMLWGIERKGFVAGAQHVIEHPERYGLQKKIAPIINVVPGCDFEDFHSKYSDADE